MQCRSFSPGSQPSRRPPNCSVPSQPIARRTFETATHPHGEPGDYFLGWVHVEVGALAWSRSQSLLLMLNMACTLFRLTPEEALAGVTCHAAKALGMEKSHGTLEVGKVADIVEWDIKHPAELAYAFGSNPCHKVYAWSAAHGPKIF